VISSLKRQFLSRSAVATIAVMLTSMFLVDISYRSELKHSSYDQLRLHIYSLLSVAQHDSQGIHLPSVLTNPNFNTNGSGVWAMVLDVNQHILWQSLSLNDVPDNLLLKQTTGSWLFKEYTLNNKAYFTLSFKIAWETETDTLQYIFVAAEDERMYQAEVTAFRWWLIGGFSLITLSLLILQSLVLSRSFRPITSLENEITAMENGFQSHIEKTYPSELVGVTRNLNTLIEKEYKQREKYRESMADLAHSLKTPLSVIRGELRSHANNQALQTAIERIDQSIEYQLRRAVISGHTLLTKGTKVSEVLTDLLEVLEKVYIEQARIISIEVDNESIFYGDENDLFEILGNLLDNAFKYSTTTIKVTATQHEHHFSLSVEDDGKGINHTDATHILKRGARLDSQGLGQGIGLAVVANIVQSYEGKIEVSQSSLGGAKFILTFPFRDQKS